MLADKAGMRRKPKGPIARDGTPIKQRTEKEKSEILKILFASINKEETDEQRASRIRTEIKNNSDGSKR